MKKIKIILFLVLSVLIIFGINCGSNSSSDTKKNNTPIADAGIDRTVTVNTMVILDGSKSLDSDGDTLTYRWRLTIPVSSQSVLSDSTVVNPTLIPDIAGTYTVNLVVNDGKINGAPDSVTITAVVQAGNSSPTANAGTNQTTIVNTLVTLDGSASSDPDNDSITYNWSISKPSQSNAVLSDNKAIKPTFTPDIIGSYVASLVVNDGKVDSNPSSVTVTVSTAQISYSNDIQPIFNSFCIGCHSASGSAPFSLVSSVSYNNLVNVNAKNTFGTATKRVVPLNATNSILYLKISGSTAGTRMPSGSSLSQNNINLIKTWIEQGANNN